MHGRPHNPPCKLAGVEQRGPVPPPEEAKLSEEALSWSCVRRNLDFWTNQ